jgi:hypothetical protein
MMICTGRCSHGLSEPDTTINIFVNFESLTIGLLTHGVIGNTSDFGSAESWFEPRWVNEKHRERRCFSLRAGGGEKVNAVKKTTREACPRNWLLIFLSDRIIPA